MDLGRHGTVCRQPRRGHRLRGERAPGAGHPQGRNPAQPGASPAGLRHRGRTQQRSERLLRRSRHRRRRGHRPLLPRASPRRALGGALVLSATRGLLAAGALALVLLASCNLDLTGATCNTNENCPVRQFCSVPSGARQGTCQLGDRITATLALTADPSLIPAGSSTQAVATLTADGGPPGPDGGLVTDLVSWSVDPGTENVISVGNDAGTRGLVEGLQPGQGILVGTISFAGRQLQATTTIVVSNAELQRVVVVPDRVQYAAGTAGNATAIGFFSDGSHADLTSLVKWTSSGPSVLAVSTASGSWGRLNALAPGVVRLQASYLDVTASTAVTVSDAKLNGLAI